MSEYPKEFLELVKIDQPGNGMGSCWVTTEIRMSIGALSVTCNTRNSQVINGDIALAGLFAAWNKQKEIEGK